MADKIKTQNQITDSPTTQKQSIWNDHFLGRKKKFRKWDWYSLSIGLSRSSNKVIVTFGRTERKMLRSEGTQTEGSKVGKKHRPLSYKECHNFILLVQGLNQWTFHPSHYFVNITSLCLPSTWSCSLAVRTTFSLFLYAMNCCWVLVNCNDNCSKCSIIPGFTWVSVTQNCVKRSISSPVTQPTGSSPLIQKLTSRHNYELVLFSECAPLTLISISPSFSSIYK